MRREAGSHELLLLAALLLFVAGLCLQPITESDLFFRLKVGQEILSTGRLLRSNQFSFTAPDHPDLDLAWGFEIAVAVLHRAAGFRAVVAGKAIWMVATFAGAFAVCRRRGAGPLASTLALAAAAFVMRERLVERPHLVSFAGEVVVLGALASVSGDGASLRWRHFLAFGAAMVVWANMHAGVFAGLMMSLLAGGGALVSGRWAGTGTRRGRGPVPVPGNGIGRGRALRAWTLTALVTVGAGLNPVGPAGMVRYLALHITLPRIHAIDEFRSATWRSDAPFFSFLLVAALIVAAAHWSSSRARGPRHAGGRGEAEAEAQGSSGAPLQIGRGVSFTAWDVLPALGMVLLGLASVRFYADAVLVSAPLLAGGLTLLGAPVTRQTSRSGLETVAPGSHGSPGSRAGGVATALTLVGLGIATVGPRVIAARAGQAFCEVDVDPGALPLDAIRFVEQQGLRERMYNDFETGSYLLFEGYPRYRVFVDPRLPAYPREMHQLLGAFDLDRGAWGAAMTRYGVETALLGYAGINRRVAWWAPDDWALVYRARDARVFVRRLDKWRRLIAAREIPATFEFSVETGTATRPLERKPAASPVPDCEWQRRLGDLIFELGPGDTAGARPHFERALEVAGCLTGRDEGAVAAWLGALELDDDDREHALGHLDRALELEPDDLRTRANRATILERSGRLSDAASDWRRIARAAAGTPLGYAASARARRLTTVRAPAAGP